MKVSIIVREEHCVLENKQVFVKAAPCISRRGHLRQTKAYLLGHTVYDWLCEHDAFYNYNENTRRLTLYDENVAFAFKMRWG